MVATKQDNNSTRIVKELEGVQLAKKLGIKLFEVSAKTNHNIQVLLTELMKITQK